MTTISFAALPVLGAALDNGIYAGVATLPDGKCVAIILLPAKGTDLTWKKALTWAEEQGGELPSRPIAALLYANVKSELTPRWHWTSEAYSASFAWGCYFDYGYQDTTRKSYEGCAVAVRLIPLIA